MPVSRFLPYVIDAMIHYYRVRFISLLSLSLLLLFYFSYEHIPQYITENGLAWEEPTVADAVNDTMRQQYLHDHIEAVGSALQCGADVRGYFVWSFQVRRDRSVVE